MTGPLDFSSVGSAKNASPLPKKKPSKLAPTGLGSTKGRGVLVGLVIVALAAVVGFVVFDRGEEEVGFQSLARYCTLATEFDRLSFTPQTGADPAAITQLLQQMGDTVEEMTEVAPAEIRKDVAATVAAVREAAAGDPAGITSSDFQDRRQRIAGFQQTSCAVDDQYDFG